MLKAKQSLWSNDSPQQPMDSKAPWRIPQVRKLPLSPCWLSMLVAGSSHFDLSSYMLITSKLLILFCSKPARHSLGRAQLPCSHLSFWRGWLSGVNPP